MEAGKHPKSAGHRGRRLCSPGHPDPQECGFTRGHSLRLTWGGGHRPWQKRSGLHPGPFYSFRIGTSLLAAAVTSGVAAGWTAMVGPPLPRRWRSDPVPVPAFSADSSPTVPKPSAQDRKLFGRLVSSCFLRAGPLHVQRPLLSICGRTGRGLSALGFLFYFPSFPHTWVCDSLLPRTRPQHGSSFRFTRFPS